MYCVYCNEDHPADEKFSPEHIIPLSLGGSNAFTIQVCERINNRAGNDIDKPFAAMFPVNADRFFADLASHRGMPMLDLSGKSIIDGKETEIQSTVKEGKKTLRIASPTVETIQQGDRNLTKVFADPEQGKQIILGMLQAATAKGKTMTFVDGTEVTPESLDRYVAENSVATPGPSVVIELDLDGADAVRFLAKVALATGFHIAGETFGRSAIADRLRTVMNSPDVDPKNLPGRFWPFMEETQALDVFCVPESHIIALMPDDPNSLVISLFGGSYTALVPLHSADAPPLLPPRQGKVFQLSFKQKQFKQWTYDEYLLARLRAPQKPE